jgi:prepilin peptidase CpaA
MNMPTGIEAALIALVCAAAWSDLRTRKIPNWINASGTVIAFSLHIYYGGLAGALQSLAGMGLGFAIFLVLYLAGGMGAGDVKLFGAVGAFLGPQAVIIAFVFTGLFGGIAGVVLALSRGRLQQTLTRARELLIDAGTLRWREMQQRAAAADGLRLPYGAVIAGGTLACLIGLR